MTPIQLELLLKVYYMTPSLRLNYAEKRCMEFLKTAGLVEEYESIEEGVHSYALTIRGFQHVHNLLSLPLPPEAPAPASRSDVARSTGNWEVLNS